MKDEGLETMNISFLRGHVSQLAQSISQVALKPGEEEIKKKAGGSSGSGVNPSEWTMTQAQTKWL